MAAKPKVEIINKNVITAIVDAVSHQIPLDIAAEANGIKSNRLIELIQFGREDLDNNIDSIFSYLVIAIRKAEMQCIRDHIDKISARPDNWEAHAWLLERRWSSYYSL